jgi:hypothetical protein
VELMETEILIIRVILHSELLLKRLQPSNLNGFRIFENPIFFLLRIIPIYS